MAAESSTKFGRGLEVCSSRFQQLRHIALFICSEEGREGCSFLRVLVWPKENKKDSGGSNFMSGIYMERTKKDTRWWWWRRLLLFLSLVFDDSSIDGGSV